MLPSSEDIFFNLIEYGDGVTVLLLICIDTVELIKSTVVVMSISTPLFFTVLVTVSIPLSYASHTNAMYFWEALSISVTSLIFPLSNCVSTVIDPGSWI